ncbi:MAG: DUF308 domain-containing protein [Oscillospiraceae bacterium]|nr:DUF308 domain-containing protein [Oscillospiraceae bacterium]
MSGLDIFFSIFLIVVGAIGGVSSFVRKARRGQSKFVGFVISVLFLIGGIVCLIFGFPVSEYIA